MIRGDRHGRFHIKKADFTPRRSATRGKYGGFTSHRSAKQKEIWRPPSSIGVLVLILVSVAVFLIRRRRKSSSPSTRQTPEAEIVGSVNRKTGAFEYYRNSDSQIGGLTSTNPLFSYEVDLESSKTREQARKADKFYGRKSLMLNPKKDIG